MATGRASQRLFVPCECSRCMRTHRAEQRAILHLISVMLTVPLRARLTRYTRARPFSVNHYFDINSIALPAPPFVSHVRQFPPSCLSGKSETVPLIVTCGVAKTKTTNVGPLTRLRPSLFPVVILSPSVPFISFRSFIRSLRPEERLHCRYYIIGTKYVHPSVQKHFVPDCT